MAPPTDEDHNESPRPDSGGVSKRPKARKRTRRPTAQRAERLVQLANAVAAGATLDERLNIVIERSVLAVSAERGTLFLNDPKSGELYSRVAQGDLRREIRILNHAGVAGWCFTHGEGAIIHDVAADPRFNATIDRSTGFTTRSILCCPVRTVRGEIIGVAQMLNKIDGEFDERDLDLLDAMQTQAAVILQGSLYVEKMNAARAQEAAFLDVVSDVSSEIRLGPLLQKIMAAVTRMLDAERSTLFLNDDRTDELYTEIGQGLGKTTIRFPNSVGIAGAVFTTGESINLPHAYADLRFNPAFDKQTGFFTRSMLCVPVRNKESKILGVTQVLNRAGGPFTAEDEARLKAFTAQISIGLENAKLFDDVTRTRNYNEAILQSMSNGVITLDGDGRIVTCNASGARILHNEASSLIGKLVQEEFVDSNEWVAEHVRHVTETGEPEVVVDAEISVADQTVSVNLTAQPLAGAGEDAIGGTLVLLEDISSEKRVKSTLSRYMDPGLADKLIGSGEEILGGQSSTATVLFSDVRSFTTITESLGAHGTVALLNDYFTLMVECIQREGGMLDKFIGDAIMAVFGVPVANNDDEDRAMRAGIAMLRALGEFNAKRIGDGSLPIDMGLGINTDEIVSGNIGSPKRMDYTVIGDGVNLAARLESACKQYGARILISDQTFRRLRATYRTREVDFVVVKGKTEPVGVHEVLDHHTDETFPHLVSFLARFRDARELYRGRQFSAAREAFQGALALAPDDRTSRLYVDRCDHYIAKPPGDDWDGVWTLTEK